MVAFHYQIYLLPGCTFLGDDNQWRTPRASDKAFFSYVLFIENIKKYSNKTRQRDLNCVPAGVGCVSLIGINKVPIYRSIVGLSGLCDCTSNLVLVNVSSHVEHASCY